MYLNFSDVKMDRKGQLLEVNEICEMKNCNKCILLVGKKKKDLYMWMSNVPHGPSALFHVEYCKYIRFHQPSIFILEYMHHKVSHLQCQVAVVAQGQFYNHLQKYKTFGYPFTKI